MFVKHDKKSIRLKNYNYSNNGFYFITICTKNKIHYFGKIENNKIVLNWCGIICENEILKTEKIRNEIKIHEYVIMPNHLHFIIEINKNNNALLDCKNDIAGANGRSPLRGTNNKIKLMQPKSISSFVSGFKSSCTSKINKIQPNYFKWQRNYHDRIILNEISYFNIKNYIKNNPIMWSCDGNNKYK